MTIKKIIFSYFNGLGIGGAILGVNCIFPNSINKLAFVIYTRGFL